MPHEAGVGGSGVWYGARWRFSCGGKVERLMLSVGGPKEGWKTLMVRFQGDGVGIGGGGGGSVVFVGVIGQLLHCNRCSIEWSDWVCGWGGCCQAVVGSDHSGFGMVVALSSDNGATAWIRKARSGSDGDDHNARIGLIACCVSRMVRLVSARSTGCRSIGGGAALPLAV